MSADHNKNPKNISFLFENVKIKKIFFCYENKFEKNNYWKKYT